MHAPTDEGLIGSRLGAADRLVVFPAPAPRSPFNDEGVAPLALRHHQLPPGLGADALPEDVQALTDSDGPGFTFRLGDTRYRYNRFGVVKMRS